MNSCIRALLVIALSGSRAIHASFASIILGHQRSAAAVLLSDPMRPRSSKSSAIWSIFALIALLAPVLWLAAWPHEHPITSWLAVAFLVLIGLVAAFASGTGQSRRS